MVKSVSMLRLSNYGVVFVSTILLLGVTFTEGHSVYTSSSSSQVNCTTCQVNSTCPCVLVYSFRFSPGTEVISTIESIVKTLNLQAVSVVSGFGSVSEATLRFVSQGNSKTKPEKTFTSDFLLNALSGTFSQTWTHSHAVLSRPSGSTIAAGALSLVVKNTVEVVLQENCREVYCRVYDNTTCMDVLEVHIRE